MQTSEFLEIQYECEILDLHLSEGDTLTFQLFTNMVTEHHVG